MHLRTIINNLLWLWYLGFAVSDSSEIDSSNAHSIRKRQTGEGSKRVVCYFANWSVYRSGTAKFTPQNINPYLCTHLIYAFGGLGKDDTIQPFDKYQDLEKGGYGQFAALKTYNRDLKTLLAIGGWNEGSRRFSPLVADPSRRRSFIKSAIRFLRQYNFDGVDLDWEYPSFRDGGKPEDRTNYAKLVVEMREAFESEAKKTGKDRLLITMAVPASLEYAGKGFDIETLDRNLDFFNLLTYDYHSAYEPSTNHHSPLFRPKDVSEFDFRSDLNIHTTIQFYLKQGASRDKLVLGIPTYGRSYTLVNPDAHEIGSPTDGPGEKGAGTKEDGYLAYYEICQGIQNDNWKVENPNPGRHGPYAHTKDGLWVGYDDEEVVKEKAYYVTEEGLGGIMFWTIDNDDFRSACSVRPFPLIESAKEALFGKQGAFKTTTSVSSSTSEHTRVERVRLTQKQLALLSSRVKNSSSQKAKQAQRRPTVEETRLSFEPTDFDPFNTPAPPTTPRSAPAFNCEDEGFFPHSTSCKKYFWCLEVPGQGMIAHTFTCPQGLYFNSVTDGCDFRRNVDCDGKDDKEDKKSKKTKTTTTESTTLFDDDDTNEDQTLEEILEAIKDAGGLEAFEDNIRREEEEKEAAKREEEERRLEISQKTRSRLSKLLDRKRAENKDELERNVEKDKYEVIGTVPGVSDGSEDKEDGPVTVRPNRFRPKAGIREQLRTILQEERERESSTNNNGESQLEYDDPDDEFTLSSKNIKTPSSRTRVAANRRPFIATNRQRVPVTESSRPSTTESTVRNLQYVTIDRGNRLRGSIENDDSISSQIESDSPSRFKAEDAVVTDAPQAVTSAARNLEYVTIQRGRKPAPPAETDKPNNIQESEIHDVESESTEEADTEAQTWPTLPPPTPTTTAAPTVFSSDLASDIPSDSLSLLFLNNPDLIPDDDSDVDETEYPNDDSITIQQNFDNIAPPITETRNRLLQDVSGRFRRPFIQRRPSHPREQIPILPTSTAEDNIQIPEQPRRLNKPEFAEEQNEEELNLAEQLFADIAQQGNAQLSPNSFRGRQPIDDSNQIQRTQRPKPQILLRNRNPSKSKTSSGAINDPALRNRQRSRTRVRTRTRTNTPSSNRIHPFSTTTKTPIFTTPSTFDLQTTLDLEELFPIITSPAPQEEQFNAVERFPLQPVQDTFVTRDRAPIERLLPTTTSLPITNNDYSDYYEYYEEDDKFSEIPHPPPVKSIDDYDLFSINNKVDLDDDGNAICHDVGVFPHPQSCRKFITCSRRTVSTNIVGWIYECPSYLAFDPVGGRCNWASDVVCT